MPVGTQTYVSFCDNSPQLSTFKPTKSIPPPSIPLSISSSTLTYDGVLPDTPIIFDTAQITFESKEGVFDPDFLTISQQNNAQKRQYIPENQLSYIKFSTQIKPDQYRSRELQKMWHQYSRPIDDYFRYKVTARQPPPDSVVVDEFGKIVTCSEIALAEFSFGEITDGHPDMLHLFTWHNVGHDAVGYAAKLCGIAKAVTHDIDKHKAVLSYLFLWLSTFPADFQNPAVAKYIIETNLHIMYTALKDETMRGICHRLHAFAEILGQQQMHPFEFTYPLQPPTIDESHTNIYSLSAEVLCMHFAYAEANLIRHITPSDLVNENHSDPDRKQTLAPFMTAMKNHINAVPVFIRHSILTKKLSMEYWVDMMHVAFNQREMMLLFEIIAAMSLFQKQLEKSKTHGKLFKEYYAFGDPRKTKAISSIDGHHMFKVVPHIQRYAGNLVYTDNEVAAQNAMQSGGKGLNMAKHKIDMGNIYYMCSEWATEIKFTGISPHIIDTIANITNEYKNVKTNIRGKIIDPTHVPIDAVWSNKVDLFGQKYANFCAFAQKQLL